MNNAYALTAAKNYLLSYQHYGFRFPPAGDGTIASPQYYANMLSKVLHWRRDELPGEGFYGGRWADYAIQVIIDIEGKVRNHES